VGNKKKTKINSRIHGLETLVLELVQARAVQGSELIC